LYQLPHSAKIVSENFHEWSDEITI
jgi:hypothetical protein